MTYSASRPAPKSSRLAVMRDWVRRNAIERGEFTYPHEREEVEYRIECRYPSGFEAFKRNVR
jgi:hypothetical protein